MRMTFILFSAFIFILSTSYSQVANDSKPSLKSMEVFVGSWSVKVEVRLSAAGHWETSTGNAEIIKTVGTSVLEENFTGTREGKPFITKTLLAVNSIANIFQRVFVDSEHGSLMQYEGHHEYKRFNFDSSFTFPNRATVYFRSVYTILSPDEFTIENMRRSDSSAEWDVTGKMTYQRVKN